MIPIDPFDPEVPVLPACRATVELLQGVLDRELSADVLDADPHATACATCRERVAAARMLIAIFATPSEPVAAPELTERILASIQADCADQVVVRTRFRRRVLAVTGSLAVAAAIVLAIWLRGPTGPSQTPDIAVVTPASQDAERAPAPRPVLIGNELARAGQALRDAPRPISDSVTAAPQLFAKVGDMLTWSPPAAVDMEPARSVLADIPDAARTGLEPVTGTAQKAFSRLMRDVGGVHLAVAKPKS